MLEKEECYLNKFIVCLPVYNEVLSVKTIVEKIRDIGIEVVITDGGSDDGSLVLAESLNVKVFSRPGKGKGYGLKEVLNYANNIGKKYFIYMDCDSTYPVESIPELVKFTENFDVVSAARNYKNFDVRAFIFNKLLNLLFYIIYGKFLMDVGTGFRIISIEKYINDLTCNGFEIDIEIIAKAVSRNLKIKEVNIEYHHRLGESKLNIEAYLRVLEALFKFRFL